MYLGCWISFLSWHISVNIPASAPSAWTDHNDSKGDTPSYIKVIFLKNFISKKKCSIIFYYCSFSIKKCVEIEIVYALGLGVGMADGLVGVCVREDEREKRRSKSCSHFLHYSYPQNLRVKDVSNPWSYSFATSHHLTTGPSLFLDWFQCELHTREENMIILRPIPKKNEMPEPVQGLSFHFFGFL